MVDRQVLRMSPLRRWFETKSTVAATSSEVKDPPPDPIVLAHWIVYGVVPSNEDVAYWSERIKEPSLYESMQMMYQTLGSSQAEWHHVLFRALSPIPPSIEGKLQRPPKADRAPVEAGRDAETLQTGAPRPSPIEDRFDEILAPFKVDLAEIERKLRPLLPESWETLNEENAKRIANIIREPIADDEGEAFVTLLYRALLKRNPDFSGYTDYLASLKSGRSSVSAIVRELIDSQEFRALSPILPSPDVRAGYGQSPAELLFDETLARFDVDLAAMEQKLRPLLPESGGALNDDDARKIAAIIKEPLADDQGEAFIILLYRLILQRTPDVYGYENYLATLKSGTASISEIVNQFVDSEEFRSKAYFAPNRKN